MYTIQKGANMEVTVVNALASKLDIALSQTLHDLGEVDIQFIKQTSACPPVSPVTEDDVFVTVTIFYR